MSLLLCLIQAFLSCDEEWAQHRKAIELTVQRPLSAAIPSHFCYLVAEWGASPSADRSDQDGGKRQQQIPYGGVANVIENEGSIEAHFCIDVLAGVLDVEPIRMRRRGGAGRDAVATTQQDTMRRVAEFRESWDQYDWTAYC